MAYSDFTLIRVEQDFNLQIRSELRLFADAPPAAISNLLRESLNEYMTLALGIGTEKARSEFLIAPVLAEVHRQRNREISLFSGTEFNVAPERGLTGYCDFLLSRSPMSLEIRAPVVSIVEAKKEDIPKGIPQCLAELVAAQIFNDRAERPIATLYGIITTGTEWKFLRLRGTDATIDADEYFLNQPEKIVGIILSMLH